MPRATSALGRARQRVAAGVVVEDHGVVVAAHAVADQVADQHRQPLVAPLALGVGVEVAALGGEADAERRICARGDLGEDVGLGVSAMFSVSADFFSLCSALASGR